jgi:Protein of unknown function (DUF402)
MHEVPCPTSVGSDFSCRLMPERWTRGNLIVRREVLGLDPVGPPPGRVPGWVGRPWLCAPVFVVEDSDEAFVTYIASGAEFGFPHGDWPSPDGRHPWSGRQRWTGHGTLMVQRPGDHHAVWHFWTGPDREFACWYVNLQTAFVRTSVGYDTQDLELDIVVTPDGTWTLKDLDVLDDRVAEGRFSPELARWIVSLGEQLAAELDAGRWWWDDRWAAWEPDERWNEPSVPQGWLSADV